MQSTCEDTIPTFESTFRILSLLGRSTSPTSPLQLQVSLVCYFIIYVQLILREVKEWRCTFDNTVESREVSPEVPLYRMKIRVFEYSNFNLSIYQSFDILFFDF